MCTLLLLLLLQLSDAYGVRVLQETLSGYVVADTIYTYWASGAFRKGQSGDVETRHLQH